MRRLVLRFSVIAVILGASLNGSSPHFDLRLMALQGNTQAQLRYAESLLRGGDRGAAIYWLQQASQQHEPAAALALSELIPAQQQLWLERAASYGSRAARQ